MTDSREGVPASGWDPQSVPPRRGRHRLDDPSGAQEQAREVELPLDTAALTALPTGQLLVIHRSDTSAGPGPVEVVQQRRVFGITSAILGVAGLAGVLFVAWAVPLSVAAIVFGGLGQRYERGRRVALVGIITGAAGALFTLVWLCYYLYILLG